jgi:hypothetical protein
MARYLNEREVGFDLSTIGFPNIGDCMGVVLQTQNGLYGFHAMPGDAARVSGFAQFIQNSGLHGNAVHLYGSCIRAKRCSGDKAQWRAEMTTIAGALNYHGSVSGFDMPAYPKLKDGTADTTYIEYRRDVASTRSRIFYKRMSKMNVAPGANPAADPIQRVTARKGVFVVEHPTVQVAVSAAIVQTYWNKGEMHEAEISKIDTFHVP